MMSLACAVRGAARALTLNKSDGTLAERASLIVAAGRTRAPIAGVVLDARFVRCSPQ